MAYHYIFFKKNKNSNIIRHLLNFFFEERLLLN